MNKTQQLGTESIGKLLVKFSIPAIIGMLVNALYNIVDRIFIGQGVDALALTGIGITFPFMTILMAFGMLIGIGAGALVSIKLGEKKEEEAQKILGNAFILLILITLLVSIPSLIFRDQLLYLFGASPDTFDYAKDYITIILIGALGNTLGFGLNNIIRAEGNAMVAMITMLLGAILNLLLDPLFIFVFDLGIKGAAYATIISQFVNTLFVLWYFTSSHSLLKLKLPLLKLSKPIVIGIISIGLAPFAKQIGASVVIVIFNNSLKIYGGDLAIGAMSVIMSIAMVFFMPIFGISQGVQPIIGFNYGAKQFERVKQALKLAILASIVVATVGFVVIQSAPGLIMRAFTPDTELIDIGVTGIRIYLSVLPIIAYQVISANFFQAIGKAKIAIFLNLLRQVLLLIPLILILPRFLDLAGVWLAAPVADILSTFITTFLLLRFLNQLSTHKEYEILPE